MPAKKPLLPRPTGNCRTGALGSACGSSASPSGPAHQHIEAGAGFRRQRTHEHGGDDGEQVLGDHLADAGGGGGARGDAAALLATGKRGEGVVADHLRRRCPHERRRLQHLLIVVLAEQLDEAREGAARHGLLVEALGQRAEHAEDRRFRLGARQMEGARQVIDRLAALGTRKLDPKWAATTWIGTHHRATTSI